VRARTARAAAALLSCWLACAQAAENYSLEIDAPAEFVAALSQQTLVGRWREEPGFDEGQFDLFVERAREEARAIAEAAGYYSASVDASHVVQPSGGHVIRISLVPGKPTTIEQVGLVVRGAAAGTELEAALRRDWPMPSGAVFRFGEWELAKRRALERLAGGG
jgi:translocation and assembly module TamA